MKKIIMVLSTVSLFASSAIAAEGTPQAKAGPNFEKHKAEILARIDARISRNQEEKSCVQAAQAPAEVKACQEKFKADVKEMRQQMKR